MSRMQRFSVQTIRAFVSEGSREYQCALVYPSLFTARQCDRIVEQAADLSSDAGQVGVGPDAVEHDQGTRHSRIAWVPAEEPFAWVHDKLTAAVRRANRVYGFDLIGFTEDLQFTEYEGS